MTPDTKKLINMPVFAHLSMEKLEEFLEKTPCRLAHYETREHIAMQGAPCRAFILLCEGQVRASMIGTDGRQVTIEDHEAPMLLASNFVFATHNHFPVDIIAITPCEIMVIEKEPFTELMCTEPVVLQNFLRILSDRSHILTRKLGSLVLLKLKNRIAAYLLEHQEIRNQQEVADYLGVARPSLARVLAELAQEGSVVFENRRITIADRAKLEKYL